MPFSALRGFSVNLETNERLVCCLVPCAEYERENRRVVHRDDPGDRKCRGIVFRVEKHNRRSVNQDFLMHLSSVGHLTDEAFPDDFDGDVYYPQY